MLYKRMDGPVLLPTLRELVEKFSDAASTASGQGAQWSARSKQSEQVACKEDSAHKSLCLCGVPFLLCQRLPV